MILAINSKKNKHISKENLYEAVWSMPLGEDSRALWTSILRLKSKLNNSNSEVEIYYSRNNGYILGKR